MKVRQTDRHLQKQNCSSIRTTEPHQSLCESGDRSLALQVGPILLSQGLMPGTLKKKLFFCMMCLPDLGCEGH